MPNFRLLRRTLEPFANVRGYPAAEDGELEMAAVLRDLGVNPYPFTYQGAARILLVRWHVKVKAAS